MIPIISLPAKIIKLLESNISPAEIAAGVCLGMFMGFIPLNGPMAVLLIIFFLVIKLNRLSTVLTLPIFKLMYILGVSTLTEKIGGYVLIDARFLTHFWEIVTGLPVVAYLDLNNTLVSGGLVFSGILCLPVFLVSKKGAAIIKDKYGDRIKNIKIFQWFKRLPIVSNIVRFMARIRGQA